MKHFLVFLFLIFASYCFSTSVKSESFSKNPVHSLLFDKRYKERILEDDNSINQKFGLIAGKITQNLDHIGEDSGTFQQRYWYKNEWFKSGGPIFLVLGGAEALYPYFVQRDDTEWDNMAKTLGAWVFYLEHRFYQETQPTLDLSAENLKYLSSEQAIEDAAYFIKQMNDQFSFTNVKWITMGMGYGGSLAVWMRVRHPELVSFASGSSAPIQAQVDFSEYLEAVMNSINVTNSTCASSIQSGFGQVSQLMQTGVGRASLKSTFNICEDLNSNNASFITKFWETIITPYMSIVESTDIGGAEINITNALCYFHYDNSTPVLTRMANVNDFYYSRIVGNDDCNSIDYDAYIQPLQKSSYNDDRAWLWQLCTEFGFFHSTSSKTAGPFFGGQDKVPVSYYIQQCTDVFGADYSADYLANAVAKTNSKYGGRDYLNATFIVFPNGSFDPWSPLSKLTSTDGTVVPIIMNRASHEADIYPPIVTDSNDLITGRTKIQAQLNLWLKATNN